MAVVPMAADDALNPFVCLFRCLAVRWSMASSSASGAACQSKIVEPVVKAAHRSVRRQDVGLAPTDLRWSKAIGVTCAVLHAGVRVARGARSVDVLCTHVLIVHGYDVSVVSAHVALLVLVRVLEGLEVVQLRRGAGGR